MMPIAPFSWPPAALRLWRDRRPSDMLSTDIRAGSAHLDNVGAISMDQGVDQDAAATASFPTTRWSPVIRARSPASSEARAALEALCSAYWYPLYAFIRREGNDPDRAVDLTQEFFARLLERGILASVDRRRGRFRSFLRVACRNFLIDAW